MRRLVLFVSVIVFVDTLLYAALTPLLPHFAHELHLSKSRAGALVAAFAAGALAGALPGGLTSTRFGVRRSVVTGLLALACASIGFAFVTSFWGLLTARLVQGFSSGFTWAGALAWLLAETPRARRGEMIGTAFGAAVFGALFGPVIGAAAALLGRGPVFSALGALAVALAVWTTRLETSHPAERASTSALTRALRTREFLGGLSVMSLASLLFGVLSVLGPLHLSHAGWGAAAIGAVWLTGAAGETVQAPLIGRVLDRRGHLLPVRASLLASALVSLGLATGARPLFYVPLVVLAAIAYGGLFTPAFGLIADGAEHAALAQGLAFGFMNAAWALGAMVGPAAGGAIAGATGDWIPFVLVAAVCLVTLAATRSRPEHAAVLVAGAATSTHRRRQ